MNRTNGFRRVIKLQRFYNYVIKVIRLVLLSILIAVPAHASTADTDGNTANVVVFVGFSDTTHQHSASGFGKCFLENPNIEDLFNGSNGNPEALRQYIYNISYGTVQVSNIFPQYDDNTGEIVPFNLPGTAAYYAWNKDLLVKDVVDALAASGKLSSDINVDYDNDNLIDNLMIVVPCESDNTNELFIGMHSSYAGTSYVNGKRAADYTIITESGAYLGLSQSCLLIHEYMHTLGYLDLYRQRGGSGGYGNNPVYTWDIMSAEGLYPQYPLAYQRSKVGGYFTIPEISKSQNGISIYSASAATPFSMGNENAYISESIKNNQAVILRTGYSDTEFFVVEYRKKGGTKWMTPAGGGPMKQVSAAYDRKIPGSGIIVYRVNLATSHAANSGTDPYYIYVFRPGDTMQSNGIENAAGEIVSQSFLSQESGRTTYGSGDMSVGLEGGALTYSDGHNSGIVISNVGSASGDQITFDVTIPEVEPNVTWKTEYSGDADEALVGALSTMDSQGNIYVLQYGYSEGSLYKAENGTLVKIGGSAITGDFTSGKLVCLDNEVYVTFIANDKVRLSKWNGTGWQSIWTSSESVNSGCYGVCTDETGIYIVDADGNAVNSVKAYKYSNGKIVDLGTVAAGCKYAANPSISAKAGSVVVAYREFNNSNCVIIKKYSNQLWKDISPNGMSADYLCTAMDVDTVYLGRYGLSPSNYQVWKWAADGGWQLLGTDVITGVGVSEMKLNVLNGQLHTVFNDATNNCLVSYEYDNDSGKWQMTGNKVMQESVLTFDQYVHDGRLWVSLFSGYLHRTLIKSIGLTNGGEAGEVPDASSVKVNSVSLTLNGKIGVNFYMTLSPKVAYVKMKSDKGEEKKVSAGELALDESSSDTGEAAHEYCLTYEVAAKEMGDMISLEVYDAGGKRIPIDNESCVDGVYEYSVMKYLDYVLDESKGMALEKPKLYKLCRSMKEYGQNAQVYFGYKAEGLNSVTVTGIDTSSYAPKTQGMLPEGLQYMGTSLLLKSGTCIRHYFVLENGHSISEYGFYIDGAVVRPISDDSCTCYIQIDNIPAPQFNKEYKVEVCKVGNVEEYSMDYSILSYVDKVNKNASDEVANAVGDSVTNAMSEKLRNLVNSLCGYYKAAAEYDW